MISRSSAGKVKELERGEIDHRTVFFQYLQKRMDFIAEVSTSDKPNWSQPLGLVEVLDALNFEKEKERINKTTSNKFKPEPILLSYITGKEGIKASVCIDKEHQGILQLSKRRSRCSCLVCHSGEHHSQ